MQMGPSGSGKSTLLGGHPSTSLTMVFDSSYNYQASGLHQCLIKATIFSSMPPVLCSLASKPERMSSSFHSGRRTCFGHGARASGRWQSE